MNNKAIDNFMQWLDSTLEDATMDDGLDDYLLLDAPSHEKHVHEGYVRALEVVKAKAEELGFRTPETLGGSL